MTCEDHQIQISRLIDGEMLLGQSMEVFNHLGKCQECRAYYLQLQRLNASLEQVRRTGIEPSAIRQRRTLPKSPHRVQKFWSERITVRLPVAAALILVLLLGLFFSFQGGLIPRERETVYLTKLPDIVVTGNKTVD
jgi:anti-sigma factor RsiW